MAEPFNNVDTVRKTYFINESERDAITPANDAGKLPQLESDGKISEEFLRPIQIVDFSTSGTWTKPANLKKIFVQAWGGGASGSGVSDDSIRSASGGGGGGYDEMWIPAYLLEATETVTVGAGGASESATNSNSTIVSIAPNAGGSSSFGSWITAEGASGSGQVIASYERQIFHSGSGSGTFNSVIYAGAGGGESNANSGGGTFGAGGTSKLGGNGGSGFATAAGSGEFSASDGVSPGGGGGSIVVYYLGGGTVTFTTGAGADGLVRITEFY